MHVYIYILYIYKHTYIYYVNVYIYIPDSPRSGRIFFGGRLRFITWEKTWEKRVQTADTHIYCIYHQNSPRYIHMMQKQLSNPAKIYQLGVVGHRSQIRCIQLHKIAMNHLKKILVHCKIYYYLSAWKKLETSEL